MSSPWGSLSIPIVFLVDLNKSVGDAAEGGAAIGGSRVVVENSYKSPNPNRLGFSQCLAIRKFKP